MNSTTLMIEDPQQFASWIFKTYFAFLLATVIALPVSAHPGKTDRYSGHKCFKECAEWDLYYAEYHLHDKNGRPIRVVKKKPARSRPEAAPVEEKAIIEERSDVGPAEAAPTQPVAGAAAVVIEPDTLPLPWILLLLFLLLLLVIRRNRRKVSDPK